MFIRNAVERLELPAALRIRLCHSGHPHFLRMLQCVFSVNIPSSVAGSDDYRSYRFH